MDPALPAALDALRDIHLPEPISWWPLAPGWWVLSACAVALAAGVARWWRHQELSWQASAAAELDAIEACFAQGGNASELGAALSALLRRTALARFSEEPIAALHGEAWVTRLCRAGENEDASTSELVRELTRAAYGTSRDADRGRPVEWIAFVRGWIAEAT